MGLTIEDLKPESTIVTIKGVKLTCKPLRLSHALIMTQVGELFKDVKDAEVADINKAQKNMDLLIGELIPELAGVELGMQDTIDLITQLMGTVEPADNKELKEKGVSFSPDLKADQSS
jgi:hypothetical protein